MDNYLEIVENCKNTCKNFITINLASQIINNPDINLNYEDYKSREQLYSEFLNSFLEFAANSSHILNFFQYHIKKTSKRIKL